MKTVLSTILLVGLFGNAWSGVVTYNNAYLVPPQLHHVFSSAEVLHAVGDGSGGYSTLAGSAPGGYSNSYSGVDSFADPNNRGPEAPGPKPDYGAPAAAPQSGYAAPAASQSGYAAPAASQSGYAAPAAPHAAPAAPQSGYNGSPVAPQADPIKNAATDDDANTLDDFTKDELDTAINTQDAILPDSSPSSTTTTEAPIEEEEEEIDFTPPRRSLLSRFFSFLTKQFSAIMSFLRRIWGRIRGGN